MAEDNKIESTRQYPLTHNCSWCGKKWTSMEPVPQTEFKSDGICPDCKEKALGDDKWAGEKN